jgi:dUTP pyrophosphatase
MAIPAGSYECIAPCSGLAVNSGINIGTGVIDSDYRGTVKVVVLNHGDEPLLVSIGTKITQLICENIDIPAVLEVESLDDTSQGQKGFGSTGL